MHNRRLCMAIIAFLVNFVLEFRIKSYICAIIVVVCTVIDTLIWNDRIYFCITIK